MKTECLIFGRIFPLNVSEDHIVKATPSHYLEYRFPDGHQVVVLLSDALQLRWRRSVNVQHEDSERETRGDLLPRFGAAAPAGAARSRPHRADPN